MIIKKEIQGGKQVMKRKCLAVLLAVTMVFTMAGCGSKDKEVTGDSSTEVTESVAEDTEETEEEEAIEDAEEAEDVEDVQSSEEDNEALAAEVGEFLNGTVWAGANTDYTLVMAFLLSADEYYIGITDAEGNIEEHQGTWDIDYDNIYLYENDALMDTLSWDMAEDGSEFYIMVDSSQTTFGLIQTDSNNLEDSLDAIAEEVFGSN